MASIPAGARRRPQRPLPTAPADADILGIGQGRDFRFTSPEAQQIWLREAYNQAVNADTWHLGDKVDDKVRDAILAGVGGAQPPMYRGPDRQYYFQNARTVEDATTRSHRAQHVAGKTMDQIAATGIPGEDEYVALRGAQSAQAVTAARAAFKPAADDNLISPANTATPSAANENLTASSTSTDQKTPQPAKIRGTGMAFLPRIPIDSPSAKIVVDKEIADAVEDYIRLGLNGLTGNTSSELGASLDAFFASLAGEDFDTALAARLKHYQDEMNAARERRGVAGTIVETLPGFIPIAGDISGLVADFKDYLENGDEWTAADWALVAAGMLPGAPNRRAVKSGKKIANDLLRKDEPTEILSDGITELKKLRTYSDLLPKQGKIYYLEGEARLLDANGDVDNNPLGMIFVNEKPKLKKDGVPETAKEKRIRENQEKATGHAYSIDDRTPYVPALRYLNKDGRNFIRFDGYEIEDGHVLLIDRKSNLTDFHKIQDDYRQTLKRVRSALEQNNRDAQGGALFKVAYDFDDEADANKFMRFIEINGYSDIVTVRVRKTYE